MIWKGSYIRHIWVNVDNLIHFSRFRGRNSCHCVCVELVNLFLVHRYSVDISFKFLSFRILGSDAESIIPLKPVLRVVRIVAS